MVSKLVWFKKSPWNPGAFFVLLEIKKLQISGKNKWIAELLIRSVGRYLYQLTITISNN